MSHANKKAAYTKEVEHTITVQARLEVSTDSVILSARHTIH